MRSLNGTIQNVSKKKNKGHTGTFGVSRRYSLTSVSVAPDDGSECRIHPDLQGLSGQPGGVGGHEYKGVFVCFFHNLDCVPYFHILLNTKSAMMDRSVQLNKTSWQQQEIDPLSYSFQADQFLVQHFTVLEVAVFLFVLFM